ncbi:hypothetical protein [Massilia sp. SYSU DXS3249]
MTMLACVLYLCLCGFVALRLLGRIVGMRQVGIAMRLQLFMALACIVFYSNFFLLGYLSMVPGEGVVNVGYALVMAALMASAAWVFLPVPQAAMLTGMAGGAGMLASNRTVAGTALVFAAAGVVSMFGFPQGFEVSAYHLPTAVEILRTATLQAWDGNFPHTFPANASIFWAFFLSLFPERVVSSVNLLLLFPLVVGTYTLSRLAGADRNASLLVSCGLLSVPMIAFSSVELSADIGGIAFIVLAMSFALGQGIERRAAMALAGACAGLAFGFKSVHLIGMACIGLVVLADPVSPGLEERRTWRDKILHAAIFSGTAVLACSFWLVRNYLSFDNPFYPVSLPLVGELAGWAKAADVDLTQRHALQFEWVRSPGEWLVYPWIEWHVLGQNYKHSSGLGAFFAATVPASLALVAASGFAGKGRARQVRWILLLAVVFVIGTWWLLDDHQPRYALAGIPYCMPLVAWVVSQAHVRWRPLLNGVLALSIALMLGVFLSRELALFANKILLSGQTTRSLYYEYPEAVDALPAGARILNLAGRTWHYPLAGEGLRNEVVSTPEARRMLGLPPGLGTPRAAALQSAVLRERGVSHLFVTGAVLRLDGCLDLEEQGRLDRNPHNGVLLASPRILYAVRYRTGTECRVHDAGA